MKVLKRNGEFQDVSFDKILIRIKLLIQEFNLSLDPALIAKEVINRIYNNIKTSELDEYAARHCISLITENIDYGKLAKCIIISNNHKNTSPSFTETMEKLFENNKISQEIIEIIRKNSKKLNSIIKHKRDYDFDYFGYKTLEKSYLNKINDEIIERPQYLFLRTSLGIHKNDIKSVKETYNYMSQRYFIHASPTLFNSASNRPQMSSCFILKPSDSMEGIYKCLSDVAKISKNAGGIGMNISNIRGNNSLIRGTNGKSSGIIPMLKVFNETARYVNQGGRRKGSIAVYIEPWHCDIKDFLEIRKNHGDENLKARDLFTAMWIPDLFMKRLINNQEWSLMCPDECPGLDTCYGDDFEKLYLEYEKKNMYREKISSRDLWFSILKSQIETGTPYLMFKDTVNKMNMQNNLGVIKGSNLCSEITIYSDDKTYSVCNLSSIAVNRFLKDNGEYDFNLLKKVVKIITKNLNKIIDGNYYPTEECRKNNMEHRPIGIGIQGLSNLFFELRIPFYSDKAKELNKRISETIYYASLEASMELSKKYGPYESYKSSHISRGIFHFQLSSDKDIKLYENWDKLRKNILKYGVRNSLTTAYMPTASTSQILGNFECFESITSNIYLRKTLSGEFIIINKYLVKDLIDLKLWSNDMKDKIIINNGSIQNIKEIPLSLKNIYLTSWEIKKKHIIDMASDRQKFIDQSQSMNIFIENPTFKVLSSMFVYAWKKELKTGCYYLRTRSKVEAQSFTIDPEKKKQIICSLENKDECMMCSA